MTIMGRKSSILTLIAVGSATAFRIPCTNHRNARILLKDSSRTGDYVDLPATTMSTTTKSAQKTVVSPALPFLECPATLVNSDLAGNVGFDPIGFSKSTEELLAYREAEVKHGRLAMLASAGWPVSELMDGKIAENVNMPSLLDDMDRVPSLLNGNLDSISPVWWGSCLGMTAAIDLYGTEKARSGDPEYFPGNLNFDPFGLYPKSKDGQKRMQLAEIKHGRLAMIAISGFALQEYATHVGVVNETPLFFHPMW